MELQFIPRVEFERVYGAADRMGRTQLFADMCRFNTLYMIKRAGSGHIGSSFSSMELMSVLHLDVLNVNGRKGDLFFSSKGHDAPGYYSVLGALGALDFDLIHKLRRLGGLPGHPDVSLEPVVTNTGSLGMGISKAKGFLHAKLRKGEPGRLYVLTGDGELQEGQIWESLVQATNRKMDRITVLVDHNKLQSDTFVEKVSHLGNLTAKFEAFGWHVQVIDGHDVAAINGALEVAGSVKGRPQVIICNTIKGKGVSFMEHTAIGEDGMYKFHSGAPSDEAYTAGRDEILSRIQKAAATIGVSPVRVSKPDENGFPPAPGPNLQRLVKAYSEAILDAARRDPNLVALDGDLVLDTGLVPLSRELPGQFIECGIAEQDMVSQAGALALAGMTPVVHSFACFMTPRANEQIYNNASERTRVVYAGSLAGLIPAGPGHSHQSIRDIAIMAATPGMVCVEPSCESEVPMALKYALRHNQGSTYLRLVSFPWAINFELPETYHMTEGVGVVLRQGTDAVAFAYGPVLLTEAIAAAGIVLRETGKSIRVCNHPWLNRFDAAWLASSVAGVKAVFTLDNHLLEGGMGQGLVCKLAELGVARGATVQRFGVEGVPECGLPHEVLRHHGLDRESLAAAWKRTLGG